MNCRQPQSRPAFSLIELVLVVAIIGVISAIAIPRLASASSNSVVASTQGNIAVLEHAIEHYAAEHENRSPATDVDSRINDDEATFVKRLILTTDFSGNPGDKLTFGPYLRDIPANPKNGRRRIRVDGAAAGANTHGWRFDSVTRIVEPDDVVLSVVLKPGLPKTGVDVGATVGAAETVAEVIK